MSAPPGTITGISPSTIAHNALIEQKQGQAVQIWTIGAFCIFGWELILCLPQEYRLVWKKSMNSIVISDFCKSWSPSSCKRIFFFKPVAGLVSTVISQMILGGRVYAIFSKNNIIGSCLLAILTAEIILCGIAISTIVPPPRLSGLAAKSQPPCGALTGTFSWLVTFWTMPLLFDTVAFLLTAWKAFDMWRNKMNVGAYGIFSIIWRDGLLYFFAIFSMNIVNVVIFITTSQALRSINLPATLVLQIVLSCRLVLNLRESHDHFVSGSDPHFPTKGSETAKLRFIASPGTVSTEKSIPRHSFKKEADRPTGDGSDKWVVPMQETWQAA